MRITFVKKIQLEDETGTILLTNLGDRRPRIIEIDASPQLIDRLEGEMASQGQSPKAIKRTRLEQIFFLKRDKKADDPWQWLKIYSSLSPRQKRYVVESFDEIFEKIDLISADHVIGKNTQIILRYIVGGRVIWTGGATAVQEERHGSNNHPV